MTNILERQELGYLQEWAGRDPRKPFVIRGARQVGKSTLVREFARVSGMPLVEINLERDPQLGQAFATNDPAQILSTLSLMTGRAIAAGGCLLFLDEIQAVPSALAALRYFYEEMPGLHVLAAGSLLELALGVEGFSMPVGRIEFLHMGPMTFEDFLVAVERPHLAEHLRTFSLADGFPEALHAQYLEPAQAVLDRRRAARGGLCLRIHCRWRAARFCIRCACPAEFARDLPRRLRQVQSRSSQGPDAVGV